MGHLGEGTKITTVSTQKVVLTSDNGQNFTMEMSHFGDIIKTDVVRKMHSGSLIDCNTLKRTTIISGYKWNNAPTVGIAILEVFTYSDDWVLQRFTTINSNPEMWVRSFHDGTTWEVWRLT